MKPPGGKKYGYTVVSINVVAQNRSQIFVHKGDYPFYVLTFFRERALLFLVFFSTYCVLVFKSFTILSLTDQPNQVEIRRALLEYLLNLPQIDNESIVEETGGESKILRAVKRNMECPSSQAPLNTRQLIHK